ncbi:hypothetical protein D0809_11225 [Flavobacterium circumlabens]|uniref:Uncharacterized protein n=1 Tax=Flavobacterium circumlabens TaxID=2133765 RepID=A0A4Y7UDN2_9FLAO|nr:hypothetical protein [Flavobacterium circumlabens]TCN58914.1 hypothetical protein EV142_103361 [Flavobacterium circumlabens]TEB44321.1 hypothetical protein D0809_11225 [Flavobacterium circumlabens]
MKKFFFGIYKNLTEFFDKYFIALTVLIGITCLISGIYFGNEKDWLYKLLYTIGSISLTSGIFAGIAKSNQFTEIYKKIFREIIYGTEHLENRNDLEKIWDNVTKTLSHKKFQRISTLMNSNIKKYFLPLEHDYYYNDFSVDINIEFCEENDDYIIVTEETKFKIICDDENLEINTTHKVSLKTDPSHRELTKCKINLILDDVIQKDLEFKLTHEKNFLVGAYQKDLNGKKSYSIVRKDEKKYSLQYNPIKKQLAAWIYNNCRVDITYPKGLFIDFSGLGTLNDFKIDHKNTNTHNRLKAEYKGLIYKNQGFFIFFRKI